MDKFEFVFPVQPVQVNNENLKSAREALARLSPEERGVILQEILGGLDRRVFVGSSSFITAEVVMQIQSGDIDLADVLRAAAYRVSKEKPDRGNN